MGTIAFKTPEELEQERLEAWRQSVAVSRFQAFQAMAETPMGDSDLLTQVEQWAASQGGKEKRAFDMAQEFRYTSPTIEAACLALGIDQAQKDALFAHAETIEA